ncbi:glycosyltransferase [Phenylobacterium sp.]|jgi:glycosyltransferase involved in cell wall biosynthesis|uniref:glycosyltransferase n=1 Tax=Phenylobacterium sp. TaxID=1871053 RepID=UPI003784B4E5
MSNRPASQPAPRRRRPWLTPEKEGAAAPQPTSSDGAKLNVCLFNSDDPRGGKIGGTSTYVRDFITYLPNDIRLLLIAPDEIGDLDPGAINQVVFRNRQIDFLPLYRAPTAYNEYPASIAASETFKFARALVGHWTQLRPLLRRGSYSVEVRRVELSPIVWSFGRPFIQMVHVWGPKDQPMSSILGRHTVLRGILEAFAATTAARFFSVNPQMTAMYKRVFPWAARKMATLTTWADPSTFRPSPFDLTEDKIRLAYVGRADKFKRLDLVFEIVARLADIAPAPVELHYVGDGDLTSIPGYARVSSLVVNHGVLRPAEIAAVWQTVHIGLLTSEFEGMPRALLEALSCGRPVAALHLPQLETVISHGLSGALVPRSASPVLEMAAAILELYAGIRSGRIEPARVAESIDAFRPEPLLGEVYAEHRRLHQRRPAIQELERWRLARRLQTSVRRLQGQYEA